MILKREDYFIQTKFRNQAAVDRIIYWKNVNFKDAVLKYFCSIM